MGFAFPGSWVRRLMHKRSSLLPLARSYIVFIPLVVVYYSIFSSKKLLLTSLETSLDSLHISKTALGFRIFLLTCVFTSASLAWYISVSKIPLGDITAIYNTSCFFTYFLSIFLLKERFSWIKFSAVLLSILGIFIISLHYSKNSLNDVIEDSRPDAVLGYIAAIISSLFAALYEILYSKLIVPRKPSVVFSLFVTSFIGVFTLFLGIIMFPVLHFTGLETFELPSQESVPYIILVSLLGIIFNSLFLLVIMFSGPVLAATGILISIPLTYLADYIFFSSRITAKVLIGSSLIFFGYFLLQSDHSSQSLTPVEDDETDALLA